MRTLHLGVRVADLARSLAFYAALGYEVVGRVPRAPLGELVMLKLSGDEFVTLELVHNPQHRAASDDSPLSHFVIKVESMTATVTRLRDAGIEVDEPTSPDGSPDSLTAMLTDPDGARIELVQWPSGQPTGCPRPTSPTNRRHRPATDCGDGISPRAGAEAASSCVHRDRRQRESLGGLVASRAGTEQRRRRCGT